MAINFQDAMFEQDTYHKTRLQDIVINILIVVIACFTSFVMTKILIRNVSSYFVNKLKLYGIDMGKREKTKIPESLGIVVGVIYLLSFLLWFIAIPKILKSLKLMDNISLSEQLCSTNTSLDEYNYRIGLSHLSAMTSIFAMLMLGFIDDCYDLRWRYKLLFPFAASVPLVGVYYYHYNDKTTILLPHFIAKNFGFEPLLDLGIFYYIYMFMFVIFCTNAINIYSGINGLEVGQSLVLSTSVILYNLAEITRIDCDEIHFFSMKLLLPFIFSSYALYEFNKYPARVFVGDSYCYFAGMVFAVVGILGHFSEEILLFAIPQILNFILSVPQIFKLVPCPRHRLPYFNKKTGLREPSKFEFKYSELSFLGKSILNIYSKLHLVSITLKDESDDVMISNNFTMLNLWLNIFGPKQEAQLCFELLTFQTILSGVSLALMIMHNRNLK